MSEMRDRRRLVVGLLILWLAVFAGAFVAYALTPASDIGFTAGMNRVVTFFVVQSAAAALAVVLVQASRGLRPGALRAMAHVPVVILLLALLVIVIGIVGIWVLA
ncbi:MAG: hypothetical protein AAFR47_00755 [Pseudomonadota bacterium]